MLTVEVNVLKLGRKESVLAPKARGRKRGVTRTSTS